MNDIKDKDQEIERLQKRVKELENFTVEGRLVEQMLHQERDRAQQYLDIAGVMFIAIDRNGNVTLANQKGCEILGMEHDEIIGKDWFDTFVPARMRKEVKTVYSQLMAGEIKPVEYFENPVLTKGGEERIIAWHNTILKDEEGNITGTLSSGEDITERKLAEEALRESKAFNETLLNTSPDIIYIYDLVERKNVYSNEGIVKVLGYSVAEIQAMRDNVIPNLMNPEDFDVYLNDTIPRYQSAKDGELIEHQYRMKHKDGSWCWLHSKESIFMRQDDGTPKQIFGVVEDITQRNQAEEALIKSEEKFRILAEQSPNMIFINKRGRILFVNKQCEKITGYKKKEFYSPDFDFLNLIAPEYRDMVIKKFSKHQKSEEVPSYEYAILSKLGFRIETIITTKLIEYEGDIAILGIVTDITERKQAEEALRTASELNENIVSSSPYGINIYNSKGDCIATNDATAKIVGASKDQILQQNYHHIESWKKSGLYAIALSAIQDDKKKRHEIEVKTTFGKTGIFDCHLLSISVGGEPHLLLMLDEITGRRKAEEELKKHHGQLEDVVKERTIELEEKNAELERFHDATVDREFRMKELRERIEELENKLGEKNE